MQRSTQKASLLRDTGRTAILETLNQTAFTRHNFEVVFEVPKDRAALAQVTYAHNKSFVFRISKHGSYPREPRYTTLECPGDELTEAKRFDRSQFEDCLTALAGWVRRIVEDARHTSPLFDDFQALKDGLRAEISQHPTEGAADPAQFREILERLEAQSMEIAALKAQATAQAKQLEEFGAKLNGLRTEPNGMPRDPWYTPTGTKIVE